MTWTPPTTLEERLKALLIPPSLYIRRLYNKEMKKGEREIRLIPELADKNKISLDIGANKGVYSYALLPHSKAVHAFEPNPKSLKTLRSWGGRLLTIHDTALGNKTGEATMFVPAGLKSGYSNQGSTLKKTEVREYAEMKVRTARLDDLHMTNIGFMKIDVEGFEQEVLEGAVETLMREKPVLMIEIEEKHTKRPIEQEVERVCAFGYECYVFLGGRLMPFRMMDADMHHRQPATRSDYVFNFIFKPHRKAA